MAPRLRLLLLLLPVACAEEREALAMRAAIESGQANLAVFGLPGPPPELPATAVPDPGGAMAGAGRPDRAAGLLGAPPEALRRWLGEPQLRRPEGRAEVWLYAGTGCALDLVLYPGEAGLRVAHAEARAMGAEPWTEAACLRALAAPDRRAAAVAPGGVPNAVPVAAAVPAARPFR
jgi:hypothetical protein